MYGCLRVDIWIHQQRTKGECVVRVYPPAEHTLDFLVGTGVVVGRKPLVGGDLKEG